MIKEIKYEISYNLSKSTIHDIIFDLKNHKKNLKIYDNYYIILNVMLFSPNEKFKYYIFKNINISQLSKELKKLNLIRTRYLEIDHTIYFNEFESIFLKNCIDYEFWFIEKYNLLKDLLKIDNKLEINNKTIIDNYINLDNNTTIYINRNLIDLYHNLKCIFVNRKFYPNNKFIFNILFKKGVLKS